MKKLVCLFILVNSIVLPQNIGMSLSYSTSNAFAGDLFYTFKNSSFHLGYTSKLNDTRGKEVSDPKPNYGKTVSGHGEYFTSVDIGYGYLISSIIRVNIELSVASKKTYTNYVDGRFTDGGYHMIDEDDTEIGIGGMIGYKHKIFDFFIGYNSVRKFGLGFRFALPIKRY